MKDILISFSFKTRSRKKRSKNFSVQENNYQIVQIGRIAIGFSHGKHSGCVHAWMNVRTHTHTCRQSLLFIPNSTGRFRDEEAEWNIFHSTIVSERCHARAPPPSLCNRRHYTLFLSILLPPLGIDLRGCERLLRQRLYLKHRDKRKIRCK